MFGKESEPNQLHFALLLEEYSLYRFSRNIHRLRVIFEGRNFLQFRICNLQFAIWLFDSGCTS